MSGKLYRSSLVIGGTGMLAAATRWLALRSESTIIVARRASHFPCEADHLVAVDADWSAASFSSVLVRSLEAVGEPGAALLWLHDPKPIMRWLLPQLPRARVVLMLGSMDGRPDGLEGTPKVSTVRLGSMQTASGRRWLTDDEISNGAIASLSDGRSRTVGELAPL